MIGIILVVVGAYGAYAIRQIKKVEEESCINPCRKLVNTHKSSYTALFAPSLLAIIPAFWTYFEAVFLWFSGR